MPIRPFCEDLISTAGAIYGVKPDPRDRKLMEAHEEKLHRSINLKRYLKLVSS
jgi:hypothetical protein